MPAALHKAGIITKSGVFNKKDQKFDRFRKNLDTEQNEFVLARAEETSTNKDIVITQKDVRQIQLAKGALYAGHELGIIKYSLFKIC